MSEPAAPRPGHDAALVANLLGFVRLLRRAGLPVSPAQGRELLQALCFVDLGKREHVFAAARSLLVVRREDLALFDALFARYFSVTVGQPPPPGRQARRPGPPAEPAFTVATYLAFKAEKLDRELEVRDRAGTASPAELLRQKDFAALTPEELAVLRKLLQGLSWSASLRRSRRFAPHARGESLDLRRALRLAARTGGLLVRPPRRRLKLKPRPVVLLADVSGSMERVSRLLLQFCWALAQGLPRVETFVFGTRLTRVTEGLAARNVDRALAEASREATDWGGGTRIGECLGEFNRRFARRKLGRGAVVLLLSDGWERDDPRRLARELAFLQRRCHRLLWLNPLLGREGYAPRVGGMAAALPYVDLFLPMHNLVALEELAARLGTLPPGRRREAPATRRRSAR